MVRYFDALGLIWRTFKNEWSSSKETKGFIQEMQDYISIDRKDVANLISIGIVITLLRHIISVKILEPLAKKLNFQAKDRANFPECTFKFFAYLALYVAECFVLLSYFSEFLTDPRSPWKGWHVGMDVPRCIYWIYVTEAGFYIHGIFGTLFMDIWRDDSVMLILHHILTISLIVFSLGLRYHNIGLVVLFLHDIADVFLEFTKIVKCFQSKTKAGKSIYNIITSLGFIFFATAWIGCRIYFYPILVLYSTGHKAREVLPDAPFYFFFNTLLWILFCMNVWWSYFIILLIFRIIMGKSKGIEDTRELSLSDEQFSGAFRGECLEASAVKNGNAVGKEKHSEKVREYHHKPGSGSGKEKNSANFGNGLRKRT